MNRRVVTVASLAAFGLVGLAAAATASNALTGAEKAAVGAESVEAVRALERAAVIFDRPNGPPCEKPYVPGWRMPLTNRLFTTGRPEYVMPVGAGNLSAMVSFGTDNLELHFSQADFVCQDDGTVSRDIRMKGMEIRSPGHLTLRFDRLSDKDIVEFCQKMDLRRGRIELAFATADGKVEACVYGDRATGALLVEVADRRSGVRPATAEFTRKPKGRLDWRRTGSGGTFRIAIGTDSVAAEAAIAGDAARQRAESEAWWRAFWSRAWVSLEGDDRAKLLEREWYVFNYCLASVGYGDVPPKFNGGPGLVDGDRRCWGMNMWWQNTREILWPLGPGNSSDLFRRHLDYYATFLDRLSTMRLENADGRKRGLTNRVDRLSFQETLGSRWSARLTDVPAVPVDVSAPYSEPSDEEVGRELAARRRTPESYTSHIYSSGTELLMQMFDYERFFGDGSQLESIRKLLRLQAELYVWVCVRGEDGLYHPRCTHVNESWWKVDDSLPDLCAARFVFAQTVAHGKKFGFPQSLVDAAAKRLARLAPVRTGRPYGFGGRAPGGITRFSTDADVTVYHACAITNRQVKHNQEVNELYIVHPFCMAGVDEADGRRRQLALDTWRHGVYAEGGHGWVPVGLTVARLRDPAAADCIYHHAEKTVAWPFGGCYSPGAPLWKDAVSPNRVVINDCPYLDAAGVIATGVNEMLLQSHAEEPDPSLATGGPVRFLPAVPSTWSGAFRLYARGGFEVEVRFAQGKVLSATVTSDRGNDFVYVDPVSGETKTHPTRRMCGFVLFDTENTIR